MRLVSRIKMRGLVLASLLVVLGGLVPSTATATPSTIEGSRTAAVEDSALEAEATKQNVRVKVIDFTKGEHLSQPRTTRPMLVYCAPQSNPVGCLRYEPTMSWTTPGCDGQALVLGMTYVNEMRREVPVDTTNGDFTDTAFVPGAVAAGPGVYQLQFRLFPSQLQLVTGHWAGVTFSRLALRNETNPLCP